MRTRNFGYSLALAGAMTCAGSGCTNPNKLVPVEGKVTLNGEPVAGAAVQFVPEAGGNPAYAETAADGTYKITTRDPGDGAAPGRYSVIILWEPPPPPLFRTGEGGLSRQQMQEAIEKHQEALKRAGKGYSIPVLYSNLSSTPLKVTVPAPGGRADFALSSKPPAQ